MSALTGLGLIVYLVTAVLARVVQNDHAATVVGLVALIPLGAAVVIAVRRRLVGAVAPPALLFVGVAILSAVRFA
ncbi:hypothetical protein [Cellulomonas sp. Leaf334]|uniref:hypothetical protein n=1 Tax=Cellulomonas sp. Leaf334 TaxID=1736339 RepID=UPI0006F3D10D|nr:hypothetical protein [Cellulomonas sp. Leaf334]KQR11010.1 hypothetical protein ASF78_15155 [Cellulomonas sp. Leaf334]